MDKSLLVEFGKRLKALREAKGLKQREMADIMEIKLRQYQRYEYGEIGVPLEVLNFFADYFHVTTDYLLGREQEKPPLAKRPLTPVGGTKEGRQEDEP